MMQDEDTSYETTMTRRMKPLLAAAAVCLSAGPFAAAFLPPKGHRAASASQTRNDIADDYFAPRRALVSSTRRYNFFQDMIGKAFENDGNLSQDDKLQGQLDAAPYGDDDQVSNLRSATLTATQSKWRNLGTIEPSSFQNTKAEVNLFLTGVPNKDPSNDLFGSKVNISSRDRKVGLAIPESPTVGGLQIAFLPDNKCQCITDSEFTGAGGGASEEGDWRLSEDGKSIRFRIQVNGYSRTIQTKGTIQKIYWSQEDEQTTQTSTTYSIPAGWMYGEADLTRNAKGVIQWENGVLKIERTQGLLGAGSVLVPCGKFTAQALME